MAWKPPIYITPDETAKRISRAAFPDYSGRTYKVNVSEAVDVSSNSYWSGGTRSQYAFVRLSDMHATPKLPSMHPIFDKQYSGADAVTIPPGIVCVEHSLFCGRDMGITIHARADDIAPMLPAPVNLSRDQLIVLVATRSLKNSYGGESDIRFKHATRKTGITRDAWDSAKAELTAAGYLDKRGSVTIRGRNARADIMQLHNLIPKGD